MLADRRLARRQSQRQRAQRGVVDIPVLGGVAEQPFDVTGLVVELDDEVLAAGDEQRVVGRHVDGGIHVEPVDAVADEVRGIVAAGLHCRTEDRGQVPLLQHAAVGSDFGQDRFDLDDAGIVRIELGQQAFLAEAEVVVEVGVARRGQGGGGEGTAEVEAAQFGRGGAADIEGVAAEPGRGRGVRIGAEPAQVAVAVEHSRGIGIVLDEHVVEAGIDGRAARGAHFGRVVHCRRPGIHRRGDRYLLVVGRLVLEGGADGHRIGVAAVQAEHWNHEAPLGRAPGAGAFDPRARIGGAHRLRIRAGLGGDGVGNAGQVGEVVELQREAGDERRGARRLPDHLDTRVLGLGIVVVAMVAGCEQQAGQQEWNSA